MKDTFNAAWGYLGKACGNQTKEQSHQNLLNLVLKAKWCEAVQLFCERKKWGGFQPKELAGDRMVAINETVVLVLEGKHPHRNPQWNANFYSCQHHGRRSQISHAKTFGSVMRKLLGDPGPGDMDSEDLQGWLLKFGEDRKILCATMEFVFSDYAMGALLGRTVVHLCMAV